MIKHLLTVIILCAMTQGYSQTINFEDSGLKQYLIHELCIDTTNDGFGDMDADFNNDGQIQLSEAISITNLRLYDLGDHYGVESIEDLDWFQNLKSLQIYQFNNISEITNLKLDSLSTLLISSCAELKVIDISNLTGLTDVLKIEDLDSLDYLNIKNGHAAQTFSLFYSENIYYACVDSIASEYNEVTWHMIDGHLPTIDNCNSLVTINYLDKNNLVQLSPNPTNGIINIKTDQKLENTFIYTIDGLLIKHTQVADNQLDASLLPKGMYVIKLIAKSTISSFRIIKE